MKGADKGGGANSAGDGCQEVRTRNGFGEERTGIGVTGGAEAELEGPRSESGEKWGGTGLVGGVSGMIPLAGGSAEDRDANPRNLLARLLVGVRSMTGPQVEFGYTVRTVPRR